MADALAIAPDDPLSPEATRARAMATQERVMGEASKKQGAYDAMMNKGIAGIEGASADYQQAAANRPQLQQTPAAPKSNFGDDAGAWLTAATMLGALAGGFSRKANINALTAFTGTLQGAQEGNRAKFEEQEKAWEAAVKEVQQTNQQRLDAYKQVLEDKKMAMEEKFQVLQLKARQFQDDAMFQAAAMRDPQLVAAWADNGMANAEKYKEHGLKVAADEKARAARSGLMSDEALRFRVMQYLSTGDKSAIQNLGRGTQGSANLTNFNNMLPEVAAEMGLSPEETGRKVAAFGAITKADRDFATGPQGNAIRSFSVALSHMDTLQELGDALKNGDVQRINAAKNRWNSEFGSPAPDNFTFATQIVSDEVLKAVLGSGAGTGGDRERLQAAFANAAKSPAQISDALRVARELMGGQLGGLKQQYMQTTGGSAADFDARLSPAARKALLPLTEGKKPEGQGSATPGSVIRYDAQGNRIKSEAPAGERS
jgi:hypothetical protein